MPRAISALPPAKRGDAFGHDLSHAVGTCGEEKATVDALIREVITYSGYFPKHLALELRNALDASDWADARRLLEQASLRPAAWLATEQLRF